MFLIKTRYNGLIIMNYIFDVYDEKLLNYNFSYKRFSGRNYFQ